MRLSRFSAFAWGVVVFNLGVIVWGAYVRASLSGDGCGSSWPLCNGEVVPLGAGAKTIVEFTHRATSGVALVLVVALVVWALRALPKRHPARGAAVMSLGFIVVEALIGALLVRYQFVAGNPSASRAVWMAVHLVNTFLLLASLALTAWWASGGGAVRLRRQGTLGLVVAGALAGTLVLAVSGAVAALGDTLFPAGSLAEGLRQDLSPAAHALVRLRLMHPLLALVVGGLVLYAASYANRARAGAWVGRISGAAAALVLLQLLVGAFNVALLAPVALQLTHLLLADLMWIALVLLAASSLSEEAPAADAPGFEPSGVPSAAGSS